MSNPDGANHEAFDLLGHEIRLAIIERLAEERRTNWRLSGLEFAELRKAVDVSDPGQFNYHLDKLVGTFVTHDDDEYVLTTAGFEVAGTVRAGTYDAADVSFDAPVDVECVACGDELTATYRHGTLFVRCDEHGILHANSLPPAAVRDRDPDTVLALAERNAKNELDRALAGACIHCWGDVDVRTPAAIPDDALADQDATDDALEQVLVEFACADCGMRFWTPASATVVRHPAVVSFYHDHGMNVQDEGYLDLAFVSGTNGTIESRDPVRVRVDVELDDDALHVRIDDTATVVDTERT
jgi:hypothetical protein